jgi:hypothetical protein
MIEEDIDKKTSIGRQLGEISYNLNLNTNITHFALKSKSHRKIQDLNNDGKRAK